MQPHLCLFNHQLETYYACRYWQPSHKYRRLVNNVYVLLLLTNSSGSICQQPQSTIVKWVKFPLPIVQNRDTLRAKDAKYLDLQHYLLYWERATACLKTSQRGFTPLKRKCCFSLVYATCLESITEQWHLKSWCSYTPKKTPIHWDLAWFQEGNRIKPCIIRVQRPDLPTET